MNKIFIIYSVLEGFGGRRGNEERTLCIHKSRPYPQQPQKGSSWQFLAGKLLKKKKMYCRKVTESTFHYNHLPASTVSPHSVE